MEKIENSVAYDLFLKKLLTSDLTEADAKALRIEARTVPDPAFPGWTADLYMRLNYHDLAGRPTEFYRIRVLTQPRTFAAEAVKPVRYLQPPGTGCYAYLPKNVSWQPLLDDITAPIYLTEGELKAACAAKHGFPTIGLGGVYSWRSAKAGFDLLPELDKFRWPGRDVFLIFDSDASTNHHVQSALHHLATVLTERGACPFIVKIPTLNPQTKTGLDDFLVARGDAGLRAALDVAEPFESAVALWELNRSVCFVRDPGLVVELATGLRMSPSSFMREVYAPLSYVERSESSTGVRLIKRRTAEEWMRWPMRHETARITYKPGEPPLTDAGELNTWRGPGLVAEAGDVAPWHDLINHLFANDDAARVWFLRWCAYPLIHPGTKLLSAVVMWGVHQGTGKSLVGYTLGRLYGERNTSEVTQEDLRSSFNDWLVDKQLILGEEITGSDRRADADRLKQLITARSVRINLKHVREYTVPAVSNFLFTSNHPDAFFLEDNDRRFFVHEVLRAPLPQSFYEHYAHWYQSDAGAAALLYELLKTDLGGFDPSAPPPETIAKREMIEDNKSDLSGWVLRLKRDPRAVLAEGGFAPETSALSTSQLLALYDPTNTKRVTLNGLGRELKRALVPRVAPVPVTTRQGVKTSYCLYLLQRESLEDQRTTTLSRLWEARFGPGS